MNENYDVFDILVEDDADEVYCVSFVDRPAMSVNYIALEEQTPVKLAIESEEKRIVTGPVLIPEKLIYREGLNGPFYIKFSSESIEKLRNKFHLKGYTNKTNKQHDGVEIDANYTIESYITTQYLNDSRFNLPVGTWLMTYKVEDDKTWELIKQGKLNGFSVEAFVTSKKTTSRMEKLSKLFMEAINKILKSNPEEIENLKLEDSDLVSEVIKEEEAEVVSSEDQISEPLEEIKEESIELESEPTTDEDIITTEYSNAERELKEALLSLEQENNKLKEELAKQKDNSALNLSKTSSINETRSNEFTSIIKLLKNDH